MATKNYPTAQPDAISPNKAQELTTSLLELNSLGIPKTIDELKERTDQYFSFCQRSRLRPCIQGLCLALHITRQTLKRWCDGECGAEKQEVAQNAKQLINTFLEEALMSGLINPASGIFLLKNWCGYKDVSTFEVEENTPKQADNGSIAAQMGLALTQNKADSVPDVSHDDDYNLPVFD